MDGDRKSWPIIVGITAGIIGGVVAGVMIYNMKESRDPDMKLRDAQDLISQCHDKIKEIEAGLKVLREPLTV